MKEARRLYIMSAKKNRKYVASTLFKDRFAAQRPTSHYSSTNKHRVATSGVAVDESVDG